MERGEKPPRLLQRDFDYLCPCCGSRGIYRAGSYEERLGQSPKCPKTTIHVWRCAICLETFEVM